MALLLSQSELARTEPADRAAFESPVPTQIVSNGEFNPLPQTTQQRRVEQRIKESPMRSRRNSGLIAASFCEPVAAWRPRSWR
jgi:hypothetical protein